MRVKISDVQAALLKIILDRSELSKADAELLAADYLEGELQGKQSHGIAAFPGMVSALPSVKASFKVIKQTAALLYVDAEGSLGAIVGRKLADLAIKQAETQGIAIVLIREMKTWLRPASIARYIADQGMVGWVANSGRTALVAPPGGREPVISTNPVGIGIPAGDAPVVVDMATSTRAWGEVRQAKSFGHALPADSFLDSEGQPTLDADEVHSAMPMGGYKGFGLGLLIEILGGSLVGMPMGEGLGNTDYRRLNRGATILVINPDITVGQTAFQKTNGEFIDWIRQTAPAVGSDQVTIPGDRATIHKRQNLKNNYLELDTKLWQEITALLK